MEDRIVIKYKYVDPPELLDTELMIAIVVALFGFFSPLLWILVVMFVIVELLDYHYKKKQRQKFIDDIPALVIDGYNLDYEGKTVDLSKVRKVIFNPDIDYNTSL